MQHFQWPYPCFNTTATCNGRGTCSDQTCECDEGWEGLDCLSIADDYYWDNTSAILRACNCSASGNCQADGSCNCRAGYTGPECKECVAGFVKRGTTCEVAQIFASGEGTAMLARDALLLFMAMTAFLALPDARLQMACATTQSPVMEHASARMVSPVLHAPPAPQATSGLARHVNPAPVVAAAERCAREKALAMAMGFRSEQVSVHAFGGLLDQNATVR